MLPTQLLVTLPTKQITALAAEPAEWNKTAHNFAVPGHLLWQFKLNSIRRDRDFFPLLCFAMVTVTSTEAGIEKLHRRRKVTSSATTETCPSTHPPESSSHIAFSSVIRLQKKYKTTSEKHWWRKLFKTEKTDL